MLERKIGGRGINFLFCVRVYYIYIIKLTYILKDSLIIVLLIKQQHFHHHLGQAHSWLGTDS